MTFYKITEYKGRNAKELWALAYSEVVAEMMEPVLTDTDAISRISQKIKQQDRSLWEKIKDFIKGIVEKLKAAYRDMEPDSAIARLTRETVTNSEAVLDAFSEAAADAVLNYNLQEGQKNNAREGERYSDRASKYSYEYFTEKADMSVTAVDETQSRDRESIIQAALRNAKEAGRTNENGNALVYVNDIGRDVLVGKKALAHGLDRRASTQAPVLAKIGDVLKNAVKVNELSPRSESIKESYVLVGAARSETGLYVASFVVNQHSNEITSIDVLYAANAKKEPAALLPKITEESVTPTGSKISIAKLLDIVNELYPDILPEEVLKHYGHTERPAGKIGESALYSSRTASDSEYLNLAQNPEKNREALSRMVENAAKEAGYTRLFFHGSKKGGGFTVFRDWQYFTENREYAKRYANRENPGSLYETYVKMENPFDTRIPEVRELFEQARQEYGMGELQENGLPDWTDGYDIADYIDENDLPYDGIILDEGGDMVNGKPVSRGLSYVIRDSSQVKSADAVTYDDNGNVIPLSQRFDMGKENIRYSARNPQAKF